MERMLLFIDLLSSNLTHAEIWGGKLTNSGVTWKERGDIIIKIKK